MEHISKITKRVLEGIADRNKQGKRCPQECGNYLEYEDDDLCGWCQDERDAEQAGEPSPWGKRR